MGTLQTSIKVYLPPYKGENLDQLCRRTKNAWNSKTTALMNGISVDQPLKQGQLLKIAVTKKYKGP